MLMSLAPTGAVLTLSTAVQGIASPPTAGGGAAKHFEPWQRRRARQTDWRGKAGRAMFNIEEICL